jgi:hypothetical protein
MSGRSTIGGRARRLGWGLPLLLLALGLALSACGRRGDPHPPPGEESSYVYPRFYPNPDRTLAIRRDSGLTLATDEAVDAEEELYQDDFGTKYDTGSDGFNRTSTKVYGSQ